jgi:hypothetical protein
MNEPTFDREQVYDEEIAPLMARVIAICKDHKIPMLATFCYRNDPAAADNNTSYCSTLLPGPSGWQTEEIREAAHIIRHGASTRPKSFAFTVATRKAE